MKCLGKPLKYLFMLVFYPCLACAIDKPGEVLPEVALKTVLGTQLDLSLEFRNERGETLKLGSLLKPGRPTVIIPAYYTCPRLCGLVLDGASKLFSKLTLELGRQYSVVTFSFDSRDTVERAADKGRQFRAALPGAVDSASWSFLVGEQRSIDPLMGQLGYGARPDGGDFVHTAALIVLTPEGKISQYFTGIEFSPFDARLALVEASQGGIGSPIDHVFLFCFRFDQTKGKYRWAAFNLMRVGALATLAALVILIFRLWSRERSSSV